MTAGNGSGERSPLLDQRRQSEEEVIDFGEHDPQHPKEWSYSRKIKNVAIVSLMAILGSLASSIFAPGIDQMSKELRAPKSVIIGATSTFVVVLGFGPLLLAPISETVGRRSLYLWCLAIFALLQIPAALTPNAPLLLVVRALAGFFGAVGVANGGGTVSDMYDASQRARVMGWYLLGPLLGPSIGPLIGGLIVSPLGWRWVFWILGIAIAFNLGLAVLFLDETYAPAILEKRCRQLAKSPTGEHVRIAFKGQDTRSVGKKLLLSIHRPVKILFLQPLVLIMAIYQALIFAAMYTLYTNLQQIFQEKPYGFNSIQVGLLCLFPAGGMLLAVVLIVPRIDTIYNKLSEKHGESKPEYRLPLGVIGSVALPIAIFAFGWLIEYRLHWLLCIIPVVLFGLGQVAIFNTTQNYFVDAFEQYAASAISAGVSFRSIIGGLVPIFSPKILDSLGSGWGWSVFGLALLVIAPSPLVLMKTGAWLRRRFEVEL